MKNQVNTMGEKTDRLIEKVKSDEEKLKVIYSKLDEANLSGDSALTIDFDTFFDLFKEALKRLYELCQSY